MPSSSAATRQWQPVLRRRAAWVDASSPSRLAAFLSTERSTRRRYRVLDRTKYVRRHDMAGMGGSAMRRLNDQSMPWRGPPAMPREARVRDSLMAGTTIVSGFAIITDACLDVKDHDDTFFIRHNGEGFARK